MQSKKKKRTTSVKRLPKDFPWLLLHKMYTDFSKECVFVHFAKEFKKFELVIRSRNIQAYIAHCKACGSLSQLSTRIFALEQLQAHPGREQILREVRALRALTFLQKFDFPNSPFNKIENAYIAFKKYEALCKRTNSDSIFETFRIDTDTDSTYDDLVTSKVLRFAEQFIVRVIGVKPDDDFFSSSLRHGPGASFDRRGNNSILIEKYIPPIDCSMHACEIFENTLRSDPRWDRAATTAWLEGIRLQYDTDDERFLPFRQWLTSIVSHSEITFVPKDSEKHRTINIEPTANIYLQLGVDNLIRRGLLRYGIDINTQEKNQVLAGEASKLNHLVTMDLSGASDCVALNWLHIFPEPWARLLNALRMDRGIFSHNNEEIVFEKLSSMGNGYTFAVETLIFSALLYGVIKVSGDKWSNHIANIAIYGDDIIIPEKFFSTYHYVLHRLGFRVNVEKTFSRGAIRESCGHDFCWGYRIDRPTLKCVPTTDFEVVLIHNLLFSWCKRCEFSLHYTLKFLLTYVGQKNFGPYDPLDMSPWIFVDKIPYRPFYHKDYQAWFWKLKRTILVHPSLYKKYIKTDKIVQDEIRYVRSLAIDYDRLPSRFKIFSPMCFLNRDSSVTKVGSPSDCIQKSDLFYLKKIKYERTVVALVRFCSESQALLNI